MRPSQQDRIIAAAGAFVLGAFFGTACVPEPEPIVITDINNVIIDMPPDVQWDVVGMTLDECNHSGGDFDLTTGICHDIDY